MEGFPGERHRKTLTFTRQDTAIGRPCSHHGDQVEAQGKGPEVIKKRAEGKWRQEKQGEGDGKEEVMGRGARGEGRGKGSSEETRGEGG